MALGAALLLMVLYGLIVGGDYGLSIDEPDHIRYAQETLEIYRGQRAVDDTIVDPRQHGPFYSFTAYFVGQAVAGLRVGWTGIDGMHFMYYLSFVMATGFLWALLRRYVAAFPAWTLAAAFFSQPVLLGHSFINPKDIPFMAFTLGSLALGLLAVPGNARGGPTGVGEAGKSPSRSGRLARSLSQPERRWLLGWSLLVGLTLGVLWLWDGLLPLAQSVLAAAYRGQAPAPIQSLFGVIATDAWKTPLDLYVAKLSSAFALIRYGASTLLVFGTLLAWLLSSERHRVRSRPTPAGYATMAGAGMFLGLATAIRAIAPFIALPLVFLALLAFRRRALPYLLVLGAAATLACLATWPFLWVQPVRHYLQSIQTLSQFPWTGNILFNGQLLREGQQPWYFIPALIGLQLTLPVLILGLVGAYSVLRWGRRLPSQIEVLLVLGTLLLPILASLQPGTIVYNNFRQFLFTLPAIFLLAGLGLDQVTGWLRDPRWKAPLGLLVLLPGIVAIARLHPYEYVFYNGMAGSRSMVPRRFEVDYWCTSYREAIRWIGHEAPEGTRIEFGPSGFASQFIEFAREDLDLIRLTSPEAGTSPGLAIICNSRDDVAKYYPEAPVLLTIERGGIILGEVKRVDPQE